MKITTIIKYFRPPPPSPKPPLTLANEFELADATDDDKMFFMAYGARDIIGSQQVLNGRRARDVIPTLPRQRRKTIAHQFVRWMMRLQGARDYHTIRIPKQKSMLPQKYNWTVKTVGKKRL